ncbi:hypothetical protein CRG98_012340 [Punica granatum]|uniref:Uncharacterized protein n=1 Tax=Punica granatum TaxID=22663 RepID=A0A2I0KFI9_PUNGR|nr:hypothetical protein CRG98_012340 [Punica granatum]
MPRRTSESCQPSRVKHPPSSLLHSKMRCDQRPSPSRSPTPHDRQVVPTTTGRPPAVFTLPPQQDEQWPEAPWHFNTEFPPSIHKYRKQIRVTALQRPVLFLSIDLCFRISYTFLSGMHLPHRASALHLLHWASTPHRASAPLLGFGPASGFGPTSGFGPAFTVLGFDPTSDFAPTFTALGFGPTSGFAPTFTALGFGPTSGFSPTFRLRSRIGLRPYFWALAPLLGFRPTFRLSPHIRLRLCIYCIGLRPHFWASAPHRVSTLHLLHQASAPPLGLGPTFGLPPRIGLRPCIYYIGFRPCIYRIGLWPRIYYIGLRPRIGLWPHIYYIELRPCIGLRPYIGIRPCIGLLPRIYCIGLRPYIGLRSRIYCIGLWPRIGLRSNVVSRPYIYYFRAQAQDLLLSGLGLLLLLLGSSPAFTAFRLPTRISTLKRTLGRSLRRPISSVGPVRLACPHGTRLFEPSLGRRRMPTRN